jgi:hypothetical protein
MSPNAGGFGAHTLDPCTGDVTGFGHIPAMQHVKHLLLELWSKLVGSWHRYFEVSNGALVVVQKGFVAKLHPKTTFSLGHWLL